MDGVTSQPQSCWSETSRANEVNFSTIVSCKNNLLKRCALPQQFKLHCISSHRMFVLLRLWVKLPPFSSCWAEAISCQTRLLTICKKTQRPQPIDTTTTDDTVTTTSSTAEKITITKKKQAQAPLTQPIHSATTLRIYTTIRHLCKKHQSFSNHRKHQSLSLHKLHQPPVRPLHSQSDQTFSKTRHPS